MHSAISSSQMEFNILRLPNNISQLRLFVRSSVFLPNTREYPRDTFVMQSFIKGVNILFRLALHGVVRI